MQRTLIYRGIVLWALLLTLLGGAHAQDMMSASCVVTEPGTIEGEDACKFEGTIDTNHEGFSGRGFVNTPNVAGTAIEWRLHLPADAYYVFFRYGNGGETDRGAHIELDGETVGEAIPFKPTGQWTDYRYSKGVGLKLAGGEHTLLLVADTAQGLTNLDTLEIRRGDEIQFELKVNGGSGSGTYGLNKEIAIRADAPEQGKAFFEWVGDVGGVKDVNAPETVVVLSGGDVSIEATYTVKLTGSHAERMAQSIMLRRPTVFGNWDYQTATVLRGFEEVWRATGDKRYFDYIESTMVSSVRPTGSIEGYSQNAYNLDETKQGSLCLMMFKETKQERYRGAAERLRAQLKAQPRTPGGGFFHMQRFDNEMWLDGLYMAEPFYCEYGKLFDEPAIFDDVALQFREMYQNSVDAKTGLLYHGWDSAKTEPWADAKTGRSPVFWSRSMGWYVMALVDVLDNFPQDHPKRAELIETLQKVCAALVQFRDRELGIWWQVPDHPGEGNNYPEASGGLMFTYAFAKGARMGYLDANYGAVAEDAFKAHVKQFIVEHANGVVDLKDTCIGTGVGESLEFYYNRPRAMNDTKGIGPFMMAGAEVDLRKGR